MNKIMYQLYYTTSIYLPQLLEKVVAAITCALSFSTGYKPVTCYKLLCPQASALRRSATHPYTSKILAQPLPFRSERIVRPVGKI